MGVSVEERILKVLPLPPGPGEEHPVAVLMRVLGEKERVVKNAVWGLIGKDEVEIGDDLGLRKVESGQTRA